MFFCKVGKRTLILWRQDGHLIALSKEKSKGARERLISSTSVQFLTANELNGLGGCHRLARTATIRENVARPLGLFFAGRRDGTLGRVLLQLAEVPSRAVDQR